MNFKHLIQEIMLETAFCPFWTPSKKYTSKSPISPLLEVSKNPFLLLHTSKLKMSRIRSELDLYTTFDTHIQGTEFFRRASKLSFWRVWRADFTKNREQKEYFRRANVKKSIIFPYSLLAMPALKNLLDMPLCCNLADMALSFISEQLKINCKE